MAGNYPDVPGPKVFYESDGSSLLLTTTGGVTTEQANAVLVALNDETATDIQDWTQYGVAYATVVFPELRDLLGLRTGIREPTNGSFTWYTSADTTNGIDGIWTSRGSAVWNSSFPGQSFQTGVADFRSGILAASHVGVKGVRVAHVSSTNANASRYLQSLHIYATRPSTSTPDRLTLWHPTLDQELSGAGLDFGDVVRGSTYDKTFRVKNRSAALTANAINIAVTAATDGNPTFVSQYTLGIGGSFGATQSISSLAPGAISAVVTLRLTVLTNAALWTFRQKVAATASTWT